MTEEDVPNTTFLKWVVSILGILIVGVAVILIVTIYKRTANTSENTEISQQSEVSVPTVSDSYGTVEIPPQSGMKVLDIKQSEGNLLIIYGDLEGAPRKIIVIDPNSGATVGQIVLKN